MPFGSSQWMYNSGADFYNGVATQSLRLDDGSSAYLTFTTGSASSATDRRKVTHSVWVKRGVLGTTQTIYSSNRTSGGDYYQLSFGSDNKLTLVLDVDTGGYGYDTSAVFRDVGAWYHVCVIIDTTQATDTDRVKIYVNGVLQDKTTKYAGGHVAQNFSTYVMDGSEDEVGRFAFTDASYFDGYMSEFITTIGQDNTISEFGELKNGIWIPIEYTGSYGTNGFRLQFNQTGTGTASSSTIGADTSGNANHFSSSGIVASDCDMPDSPENNFATFGVLNSNTNTNLSEGGLRALMGGANNYDQVRSDFGLSSGKWYWEIYVEERGYIPAVGVFAGYKGNNTNPNHWVTFGFGGWFISNNSSIPQYNVNQNSSGGTNWSVTMPANGDVIMIAIDVDNNKIWWGLNGTWYNSSGTANPATGTDPRVTLTSNQTWHPMATLSVGGGGYTNEKIKINFGQDDTFAGAISATGNTDGNGVGVFKYAPPSGYLALCTSNLPEPTISPNETTQADDYFNTVLNSGDGSAGSFTGVGFQPDFVWAKNRTNAYQHELWDVIRGVNSTLFSAEAYAEDTTANRLVSFDSDGFSYGTNSNLYVSSTNSVAWCWKAGGTAVSNTDGTITSSVSANTDAGFSIVTYSANNSAGATVGHGLGVAPKMVIVKKRNVAERWFVWHTGDSTEYMYLNETFAGQANLDDRFGNDTTVTLPSSTVLTLGTNNDVNGASGTYVAYCFAEIEGYSKFGSYTGNGSSDGTFVYLGFRPAWVLIKNTDTSDDNWYLADDTRDTDGNPMTQILNPNTSVAEYTTGSNKIDFTSNGIKMRDSASGDTNISGEVYIYMAFARTPFKYSLGK